MKIISSGKTINLPSGGIPTKTITRSDYRALAQEEKMADILYIIEETDPPANLNDADWNEISNWSKAGILKNYYSIGDSKKITIGGNFNNVEIPSTEIELVIAGFDHNMDLESPSEHCTHFLLGRVSGILSYIGGIRMFESSSGSNAGGWEHSFPRKIFKDSSLGFRNILPADLKAVMRSVFKYTNNVGFGTPSASNITSTTDSIAVLSQYEMFGLTTNIDPNEANMQVQYPLFFNVLSSYSDKTFTSIGQNPQNFIWTRSPAISDANNYACWVNNTEAPTVGAGYVDAAVPLVIFI